MIPPTGGFETARYGDRPFPVVPVDYSDRAHGADVDRDASSTSKINDPAQPGSTFNLYQEMSYGQLFPHGDGAVGRASPPPAGTTRPASTSPRRAEPDTAAASPTPTLPGDAYQTLQPERIQDGWYQLPGDTDYYGDDGKGSALIGALAGVGALQDIDSACGPTGKAVFDAAQIADPEIDYNDFDTDKDGVVDFFMMVFAGPRRERRLAAQRRAALRQHLAALVGPRRAPTPTRNGEKGYVSDDQLARPRGPAAVLDRRDAQREDDDATRRASRSTCASARTTSTPRRRSTTRA